MSDLLRELASRFAPGCIRPGDMLQMEPFTQAELSAIHDALLIAAAPPVVVSEIVTPLERYGLAVLGAHRQEIGDLDGAFLQETAQACGLLEGVEVAEACGEECRCAEYDGFPQVCLRLKPEYQAKMDQCRKEASNVGR